MTINICFIFILKIRSMISKDHTIAIKFKTATQLLKNIFGEIIVYQVLY